MNKMKDKEFLTQTALLERGWTKTLVKKFFPKPHDTKPNNMYRSAAPIKLYEEKIIKSVEQTKDFKKEFEKVKKRRESSKKAIKTKKAKLLKEIDSIDFEVLIFSKYELLDRAINHYNNRQLFLNNYDNYASKKSDKEFLKRIQVNYVRHVLTAYEEKLIRIAGKVGVNDAYKVIKNKVFNKISEAYPFLKEECERQKSLL